MYYYIASTDGKSCLLTPPPNMNKQIPHSKNPNSGLWFDQGGVHDTIWYQHMIQSLKKKSLNKTVKNLIPKLALYKAANVFNYRDAKDQKLRRNDGTVMNQQMKAIPVAVSNCTQWFCEQLPRSLSMSTVMPADAQAAANVSVEVTCM